MDVSEGGPVCQRGRSQAVHPVGDRIPSLNREVMVLFGRESVSDYYLCA